MIAAEKAYFLQKLWRYLDGIVFNTHVI